MALAAANGAKQGGSGATNQTTPDRTTAATGSGFITACVFDRALTVSTVLDSKSNSYSSFPGTTEVDNASGGFKVAWRYIANGVGGSNHNVTWTLSGSGTMTVFFFEITTSNGAGITIDQNGGTTDASSPFDSPDITTTVATEILVSMFGGSSGSNPATHDSSADSFTIVTNADETNGASFWTGAFATRGVSGTGTYNATWTESGGTQGGILIASFSEAAGGSPATLSSPTPSGTLGTTTTASPGASTDQASGTGYVVVDTAGNISGITHAQVEAGQNNASASAIAAANASVSGSPFTIGVTGLTANTAYGYAVAQVNGNGDSNVVTGTFTTAAAAQAAANGILVRITRRIAG